WGNALVPVSTGTSRSSPWDINFVNSSGLGHAVTEHPLVSVVTPFWNARSFIAEAIESVLAQEFQSWELLLVDDGATDGSTDIARDYAGRFPEKIRYLEHEGHANRGSSCARNLGIRDAKGAYIAFLDADDVWTPD